MSREFNGEVLLFYHEAGSYRYVLYRQIRELGHYCQVVAAGLIPRKPGEHIKTDRRDVGQLSRFLRGGDMTVWALDKEQEAMRNPPAPVTTQRYRNARHANDSMPA